jgi:hypothetical protein
MVRSSCFKPLLLQTMLKLLLSLCLRNMIRYLMYPPFPALVSALGFHLKLHLFNWLFIQDLEEGSCSSDAYTDSEDDDVDKEYSTDNDIHDEDGSYDSGEEELDDNSEHSSSGNAHDTRTVVMDEKVPTKDCVDSKHFRCAGIGRACSFAQIFIA